MPLALHKGFLKNMAVVHIDVLAAEEACAKQNPQSGFKSQHRSSEEELVTSQPLGFSSFFLWRPGSWVQRELGNSGSLRSASLLR